MYMDMHKIESNFQELLSVEGSIRTILDSLRESIRDAIRSTPIPGVTPVHGSVHCCTVSFSAIASSNTLCLCPKYYLAGSQADAVDKVLMSRLTASSFLAALADMIHGGYAKVGQDKIPLNDETLKILREIFNNLNM